MSPLTPDLAGKPILNIHSPEKSYIPQLNIIERQLRTSAALKIFSFVSGFVPPLAKVAAITAADSVSTVIEHV